MINSTIKSVALVTGGFDPLHSGHIDYLSAAKNLADILVVGVNSDHWLTRKKGKYFMPIVDRVRILQNLKFVEHCVIFDDDDGTSLEAIKNIRFMYPNATIIFANGGDRTKENIPEMSTNVDNVEFVFGIGGTNKQNSSSQLLEEWKSPKTFREWGMYRVIYSDEIIGTHTKVKELVVEPGKKLSMQRHQFRSEHWHVVTGVATVYSINRTTTDLELLGKYHAHESVHIFSNEWHQLVNETSELLKIVEIQYGSVTEETDIERRA